MTNKPNLPADKGDNVTFKDPGTSKSQPRKISDFEHAFAERHFQPPAFNIQLPDH
jgi:hypothetical protein